MVVMRMVMILIVEGKNNEFKGGEYDTEDDGDKVGEEDIDA